MIPASLRCRIVVTTHLTRAPNGKRQKPILPGWYDFVVFRPDLLKVLGRLLGVGIVHYGGNLSPPVIGRSDSISQVYGPMRRGPDRNARRTFAHSSIVT